jgi:uncharacterized protein involved in exopolysaccharide biosynthesis
MDMGEVFAAVWRKKFSILISTVILCAITFGILTLVPKQFESTASILVETRENAFTRATSETSSSTVSVADDALMASQVELVRSRDTLLQVIESQGLRDVGEFNGSQSGIIPMLIGAIFPRGPQLSIDEVTVQNLQSHLSVIRERDSRVISISFRSESPEMAASIANAIAYAHVRRRADLSLSDTVEVSQWLENEIEVLRTRVAEAEAAVASYRVDNDLFVGTNDESLLDQTLSSIAAQITDAQERKSVARSRENLIRGLLDAGQPIDGVSDVRESVIVQQLSEEKGRLQAERAQKLATLLPDHPQIVSLTAQISEIDAQILAEGRRVADALAAEAQIEASLEQTLRDELTRLKVTASTATRDGVTLNELEREAAAQRDLLETYLSRYREATSRTDQNAALPDVRVVSAAAPSLVPASPKTMLILLAVAFGSITLQVGSALFGELSPRRSAPAVPNPAPAPELQLRPLRGHQVAAEDHDVAPAPQRQAPETAAAPRSPVYAEPEHSEPIREARQVWRGEPEHPAEDRRPVRAPVPEQVAPPPARQPEQAYPRERMAPQPQWTGPRPAAREAATRQYSHESMPAVAPQAQTNYSQQFNEVPPGYDDARTDETQDYGYTEAPYANRSEHDPAHGELYGEQQPMEQWAPHDIEPAQYERRQVPVPRSMMEYAPAAVPVAPMPFQPAPAAANADFARELDTVSRQIVRGRVRIVLLAAIQSNIDSISVADTLIGEALDAGLTVARVDAGSGRMTTDMGLSDLASGTAEFGDVVHPTQHEGLSEVPWGRHAALDRRSPKPATLVEALSDIYDVVIVLAGKVGMASSLPAFADIEASLVLVAPETAEIRVIEAAEDDAAAIGFEKSRTVLAPRRSAEVA